MSSSPIAVLLPHGRTAASQPIVFTDRERQGPLAVLTLVPDPRGIRYPLATLPAAAVCAALAGAVTFAAIADWARDLDCSARARLGLSTRAAGPVRPSVVAATRLRVSTHTPPARCGGCWFASTPTRCRRC
jgi:hypothetical protein